MGRNGAKYTVPVLPSSSRTSESRHAICAPVASAVEVTRAVDSVRIQLGDGLHADELRVPRRIEEPEEGERLLRLQERVEGVAAPRGEQGAEQGERGERGGEDLRAGSAHRTSTRRPSEGMSGNWSMRSARKVS